MSFSSLPFDYDNLGPLPIGIDSKLAAVDARHFRPSNQQEGPNRPQGIFLDKDDNVREWPVLDVGATPPTRANGYGWMLNAYGSRK